MNDIIQEIVNSINTNRFPMLLKYILSGSGESLSLEMAIIDKFSHDQRHIYFHFPMWRTWHPLMDMPLEEWKKSFTRELYMFMRQAVLHEIAECFEVNGEVFDNPHANVLPGTLRRETDNWKFSL